MTYSKYFKNFLSLIMAASSVALVVAVLAGYINPREFIIPAFLGLAFPFLLIIHLVLCVLYFAITKSRLTLLFLIPLLASLPVFFGFFGVNYFSSSKKAQGSFKFLTYNVHNFRDRKDISIPTEDKILELVKEENPDIVCFQDFNVTEKKTQIIDSLKAMLHTPYFYNGPDDKKIFPDNALAILTKFPIVNSGYIYLSDIESGNQCIFVDVKKGNKSFRVYNIHLQSLKFQPKDYEKWDKGPANKISFLSKNVRRLQYAFLERSNQVKIMRREFDLCKIPYMIVGDFNDSPASYAVNEMSRHLNNAFREKGKGYQVTYDGDMPNFQIDYILTQPIFKVNSYQIIKENLSDHYPVKADLSL